MKVYNMSVGTTDVVVAARSQRAAVEALQARGRNWSLYSFRQFASTLRADHRLAVMALAQPGEVFERPIDSRDPAEWKVLPTR